MSSFHGHPVPAKIEVPDNFKKAVGIVQVAMGGLGFLHRKIHNVLLANAQEGLRDGQETYEIPGIVIAELAGFDSHDHSTLYECGRDIVRTSVEYVDFDREKKNKRRRQNPGVTSLLADFQVLDNGIIRYQFSKKMVGFLREPDQFVWVALSTQRKFSSKYQLGLYENCLRYVGVGSTGFKEVDAWRLLLGATDQTYDQFKRFNTMVLKPAIRAVNEKSGIEIEPEFEREKRKVKRIKFLVKEREQLDLFDYKTHAKIRTSLAYSRACDLGLHELQAVDWIERMGEEFVEDAIAYVMKKSGKVKNSRSYLISALENGYGQRSPHERRNQQEAKQTLARLAKFNDAKADLEQRAGQVEADFFAAQKAEGLRLIEALSESERRQFLMALGTEVKTFALSGIKQRWIEISFDLSSLNASSRTDSLILAEVSLRALERLGESELSNLAAYCSREAVSSDIFEYLKKIGRVK